MLGLLQLVVLYGFLGGSIKFIDQAYDEGSFSIKAALVLAVLSGTVMGFLMARDSPFSTAFFAAMLISLVLARKIDNLAFASGTALAVVSLAAFYPSSQVTFLVVPIVAFLVAGFVDEVADGLVHRYGLRGPVQVFLNYRPFSDFALFGMIVAGMFEWVYLLPYFAFTLSYLLVERASEREYSLSSGIDRLRSMRLLGRIRLSR